MTDDSMIPLENNIPAPVKKKSPTKLIVILAIVFILVAGFGYIINHDAVTPYLVFSNSHDGSGSIR